MSVSYSLYKIDKKELNLLLRKKQLMILSAFDESIKSKISITVLSDKTASFISDFLIKSE